MNRPFINWDVEKRGTPAGKPVFLLRRLTWRYPLVALSFPKDCLSVVRADEHTTTG